MFPSTSPLKYTAVSSPKGKQIHAFLVRTKVEFTNTKLVKTYAAVCFDMLSSPTDFIVCGRTYVKASKWCRMHGITVMTYPELGFGSR